MMHANQTMRISCSERELEQTVRFILDFAEAYTTKGGLCYQIARDGLFAVGWYVDAPAEGWRLWTTRLPTAKALADIIKDFVPKRDLPKCVSGLWEGGWLFEEIDTGADGDVSGIKSPVCGYFTVRQYYIRKGDRIGV